MIADRAARERALDTSSSFIVQAPAGSGKTELLIQRFLKLLETVESPDAVVAITFTRKAAGEMRSRVGEALRAAASKAEPVAEHERATYQIAQNVLAHDRLLCWNLAQNPAQLRIETIDGLCASMTRHMPWLTRLGAMPEIAEKAEDLYRDAARNTFRHLERGSEPLAYLLLHLDNDFQKAEQLMRQMLEKRDQWLRHTGTSVDSEAVRTTLERSLQRVILDELATLRAGFDGEAVTDIAAILGLDYFPEASLEDLSQWRPIAELLLTKSGEWRKQVNRSMGFSPHDPRKPRCENLLARLRSNDALLESLQHFQELPAPRFTDGQWEAMKAAVSVLALAVGELQLVFRERGRIDFAELAIRASGALGRTDDPADLALALGHKIQHILVDEFQDTSFTQFELLEKLTAGWEPGDGRTLFLVGDPMQSIYRFRQADVSLFLKAREQGLAGIRFEPLTLSVNFRSRPELVDWVNRTFAPILAAKDDIESGAVAYSPSTPAVTASGAVIEMHSFMDERGEAQRVIELVKGAGGGSTVAVLVRARAHLVQIVSALKQQGVAFQAIEIDQLGERPVVEDLMALTFALLHAADRVSWLAILRAPWCGLTLDDLHRLANVNPGATIWEALHRQDVALSEDGRARIQRILPVLEHALEERARMPLRGWVESAWLRLGGPGCVADETALEDAGAYFDLLEGLAEGADLSDFEWFREQVSALFAHPDTKAGPQLQLMTIFKAKGLEFDTVILPGLGTPPRKDDPPLLLWLEQRGELLLAPIAGAGNRDPIYDYLNRKERRKGEHETARLLYVAATRARERLHLLTSVKLKPDGSNAEPDSRSFLKLLWPAYAADFSKTASSPHPADTQGTRAIRRLPSDWKVPDPPAPVKGQRETNAPVASQPSFEWVSDRLRHTGTALHAFLQRIAREGLEAWDEARVRSERRGYRAVLANLGLPPGELSEGAEKVERGLRQTLRDSRGRWILAEHEDARCELSIAGLLDGALCEVVIDRTFVDENGVRWIIDYKTGEHQGGNLENFLETERKRYQEQLERYARLMAQRDGRPIRLGLYFPLLGEWREWAAPVMLRKQAQLFEL